MGVKSSIKKAKEVRHRWRPSLHLDDKDLKEIKDWSVGKTYRLVVTAKMTGMHESDGEDDLYYEDEGKKGKTCSADFKIMSVEPEGSD